MASNDGVKHLILTGVKISNREVGRGAYGRVFEVDYNGTTCFAKQLHSILESEHFKQLFLHECLLHSKLDHSNIVKMLGVYYLSEGDVLPVLVMELMEYNLTRLLDKSQDIPMYVKLSILQDVSRGVHYLHTLNPPVIHRDLSSNNILLNNNLVAKIGSFEEACVMSSDSSKEIIGSSSFFMPQHAQNALPLDVFSFGCVVCHVISQQWPIRRGEEFIPKPLNFVRLPLKHISPQVYCELSQIYKTSEVQRRCCFINEIGDGSLKQLVISCLDDDPERRPPISQVCGRITSIITGHYSNDDTIKMAYSLAMKQGVAESRDLQVLLVGAENTGKTCLISSFLGEQFVEGQAATEAVEVDVCKIYCKDWTRISDSDKTDLLHHQFVDQLKEKALDMMDTRMEVVALLSTSTKPSVKNLDVPHQDKMFEKLKGRIVKGMTPLKTTNNVEPSSRPVVKSGSTLTAPPTSTDVSSKHLPEPHPQDLQEVFNTSQYDPGSLNLALWDFPGQVIFHNTNSVYISASGVVTITFNASMKLTGEVVPREGSPTPPECATIISSIHYWLQVVDSMCSVEGREGDLSPLQPAVILAGTHIDLLDPDIKVARKIVKKMILPQLKEELSDKRYAQHLVGMGEGIEAALEQFCFFVSNKCRDEEIERLKNTAIKAATSLRKKQPIYFLKIERALLQHKEQVISKSTMVEVVTESTFPIAENSSEFEGVLRYFHDKRVILYFSQIESLKDLVILSPRWLARLFSYIITAHSYKRGKGFDEGWKRLTKYGILHESLLQHMLDKFHSDYPSVVKVSKEQVVDILLCFHLVARITREAWFSEEGYPSLPDSGDTFIVPSLVPRDDGRNPPNTKQERIIYFKFVSGFIPTSLLNQLIADCICRNVERNSRLLWMRHGKVGLQLGADQKYYISRCEEKKSIQLMITMSVRDDVKSGEERRELIDDITRLLDDIMKVFMPAVKKRPVLLVPCPNCPTLHITLDEVCSGKIIFCSNKDGDVDLPPGYYGDLLPHRSHDPNTLPGADRKFEVFTKYYASLTSVLPIKNITSHLISVGVISFEDEEVIQQMTRSSEGSSLVLRKIACSLKADQTKSFDMLLLTMEEHGGVSCDELANRIREELAQTTTGDHQPSATQNTSKMSTVTMRYDEDKTTHSSHDGDTSHDAETTRPSTSHDKGNREVQSSHVGRTQPPTGDLAVGDTPDQNDDQDTHKGVVSLTSHSLSPYKTRGLVKRSHSVVPLTSHSLSSNKTGGLVKITLQRRSRDMAGLNTIEAKVVILGAQGVGKTSIMLRHVGNSFSNRVNSTIGASFFTFIMDVDSSTKVKIQLWDTAGQERFRSMAPMYYRKANAAIIVYDITSSKSFEQAKDWVDEIHKNIGTNLALCIVGNKIDLPEDMRKVSTEKGRKYANSLGALFAETSAACDVGIKKMFTNTAMKVVGLHQDEDHSSINSLSTSQFSKDQHSQPTELPNIRLGPTQTDITSQESSKKKEGWCCCKS